MKQKLSIVKIGGNLIEDPKELYYLLHLFSKIRGNKILVHGGGKKATEIGEALGIKSKMVDGRRITDAQSLDVAIMVYGGLVNKKIVAQLQALGVNSVGLSGADANIIKAYKRLVNEVDFGFVGDVEKVNTYSIFKILQAGLTPVFCALTHDGKGQLLNTNADTIASEIAIGMSNQFDTTLYYCFEKKGVLKDISNENSVIPFINSKKYERLLALKVINEGMLPKMHNCFNALRNQVSKVCIGDSSMFEEGYTNFTTITL
ncbi:acetylglutamate kinase [Flagellimonas nanhaiensis]|uniref:Acetylglutamate kinase n=1 Tax=Flagellimonas nanhaiensis TaxID=2292706 RepID=A0A371JPR8_9FLAO|nr:acetylglutamate kinase [Allomuricauda nanhaiensis]RDY59433.1 acetylglutamate kinase [Allomuricauda nanhaiensis]